MPIPTLITTSRLSGKRLSGFAAVPHEVGHDITGIFQNNGLIESIRQRIYERQLPHYPLWISWMEEIFADTIATLILGEYHAGKMIADAQYLQQEYPYTIYYDGNNQSRYPSGFLRVALSLMIAQQLGCLNAGQLLQIWNNNKLTPETVLSSNGVLIPTTEFADVLPAMVSILIEENYPILNGKSLRDVFAGFQSREAEELKKNIRSIAGYPV